MRIAVVGSGIIGYVACRYLSDQGYDIDCISPKLDGIKVSNDLTYKNNENFKRPVSPKFQRPEFIKNKLISDKVFPKRNKNFIGIELINSIGLAKYWGANLAIKGLEEDIKKLDLNRIEKKALKEYIPQLNVQSFYDSYSDFLDHPSKKRKKGKKYKNLPKGAFSSILAIFKDKINIDNLLDDRPQEAIFGSNFTFPSSYNTVNGKVEKIIFGSGNKNPELLLSDKRILKYDFVIVACGAIGSYRLIMESIKEKVDNQCYSRIKHHPLVSTICLAPEIKYPNKFISMSNFDQQINENGVGAYLNFFPFYGALKAMMRNKKNKIWKKTFVLISNIKKIIDKLPDNPFFPRWWIHRLYVVNIYFQSDFSASFINYEKGLITLIGGFRFDFEKTCLKSFYTSIVKKLFKQKIINFFPSPILAETGADLHYSSTLTNYVDENGFIKKNFLNENKVIIVDSSSTNYLPNPNPTYYFMARTIKLLRAVKK